LEKLLLFSRLEQASARHRNKIIQGNKQYSMKIQAAQLSFDARNINSSPGPFRRYIDDRKIYHAFKRLFDLSVSLVLTIFCFSWLFPLIALLIKLDSRGPVFFIQRRVGRGGRSFLCYKFRTMVVNEDANKIQCIENDVRVTRIGEFLRKSSLDELPQFLNVLMGDMSIVGPRPHMHADCNRFSSLIPNYKFRSLVKPGITGLAQIKGYRGPTATYQSMFRRYQYDAFYVRNCNFWLDMRIIRKTAFQVLDVLLSKIRLPRPVSKDIFADDIDMMLEPDITPGTVRVVNAKASQQ
jgi:putative colanic acid biosysnthesis UDP-glucose lipid carrier transferase